MIEFSNITQRIKVYENYLILFCKNKNITK